MLESEITGIHITGGARTILLRTPGTVEGFMVVTGLTLVAVAVIVVVVTRWPKVPDQECPREG